MSPMEWLSLGAVTGMWGAFFFDDIILNRGKIVSCLALVSGILAIALELHRHP